MTQLQTDSIWEGFQNHQETVERRNQKKIPSFVINYFPFLVWSCLYLLGKHGNSVGTATPGSSVFRMAFLLVWPLSTEPWNSVTNMPSHSMLCTPVTSLCLPYFIALILVSRYFASGSPTSLNHMLIINPAPGKVKCGSDGHRGHFSHLVSFLLGDGPWTFFSDLVPSSPLCSLLCQR